MLTEKEFAAIGRLTIAFNEIDETVAVYLPIILQTPEPGVAVLIAESDSFRKRADLCRNVLDAIARERPAAETLINIVRQLLKRSIEISQKRNQIVHSVESINYAKNERMLRSRKSVLPINAQDISDLGNEAFNIAYQLIAQFEELASFLKTLRALKSAQDSDDGEMEDEWRRAPVSE
jgi:hypothetical protein